MRGKKSDNWRFAPTFTLPTLFDIRYW